jgi:hypothetical protein
MIQLVAQFLTAGGKDLTAVADTRRLMGSPPFDAPSPPEECLCFVWMATGMTKEQATGPPGPGSPHHCCIPELHRLG